MKQIGLFFIISFCLITEQADCQTKLDKNFIDDLINKKIISFSGTVLISVNGKIEYENAFGFQNYKKRIYNKAYTQFLIGSMTKPFTATAIVMLSERGKIGLDKNISEYLENLPDNWKDITVHELLTHTSGLMHSWDLENFTTNLIGLNDPGLIEIIKLYYDKPMVNSKGAFHYSGLGYFILAAIIEKVTGQSYNTFMETEVFKRLKMTSTTCYDLKTKYDHLAIGYNSTKDSLDSSIGSSLYGGGNILSNVEDLLVWDNSFYNKQLLTDGSIEKIFTPYAKVDNTSFYGYGYYLVKQTDYQVIMHGGRVPPGFLGYFVKVPDKRLFVTVLSNKPDDKTRELSMELTDYVYHKIAK